MRPDLLFRPPFLLTVATVFAVAAILSALVLEHVWGYMPCPLCLEQREPYYVGVYTLVCAALFSISPRNRYFYAFMLAAISALVFAKSIWLGGFHAGVEWGFWEGPVDCGASLSESTYEAKDLLEAIRNTKPVSCTDAALRIFGLSLAGWNAVVSVVIVALSAPATWMLGKDWIRSRKANP